MWNFNALWLRLFSGFSYFLLFSIKMYSPMMIRRSPFKGLPQLSHFSSADTGSAHGPENTLSSCFHAMLRQLSFLLAQSTLIGRNQPPESIGEMNEHAGSEHHQHLVFLPFHAYGIKNLLACSYIKKKIMA